jgi:hypothetical protein
VQRWTASNIYQLHGPLLLHAHYYCRFYLTFELLFWRFHQRLTFGYLLLSGLPHPPRLVEVPVNENGADEQQEVLTNSRNCGDGLIVHNAKSLRLTAQCCNNGRIRQRLSGNIILRELVLAPI